MSAFNSVSLNQTSQEETRQVRTSYDLFPPAARAACVAVAGAALIVVGVAENGLAFWPMIGIGSVVVLASIPTYISSRQNAALARYDAARHAAKIPDLYEEPTQLLPRQTKATALRPNR